MTVTEIEQLDFGWADSYDPPRPALYVEATTDIDPWGEFGVQYAAAAIDGEKRLVVRTDHGSGFTREPTKTILYWLAGVVNYGGYECYITYDPPDGEGGVAAQQHISLSQADQKALKQVRRSLADGIE